MREPSFLSYIVRNDSGFAPNPFGGVCTLACCKREFGQAQMLETGLSGRLQHRSPAASRMRCESREAHFRPVLRQPSVRIQEARPRQPVRGQHLSGGRGDGTLEQIPNSAHDERHVRGGHEHEQGLDFCPILVLRQSRTNASGEVPASCAYNARAQEAPTRRSGI